MARSPRFAVSVRRTTSDGVMAGVAGAERERISVLPARFFGNSGRIAHSFREHQAVLDAIIDGDEAAANRAMMAHDSTGGEAYAALVLRAP